MLIQMMIIGDPREEGKTPEPAATKGSRQDAYQGKYAVRQQNGKGRREQIAHSSPHVPVIRSMTRRPRAHLSLQKLHARITWQRSNKSQH